MAARMREFQRTLLSSRNLMFQLSSLAFASRLLRKRISFKLIKTRRHTFMLKCSNAVLREWESTGQTEWAGSIRRAEGRRIEEELFQILKRIFEVRRSKWLARLKNSLPAFSIRCAWDPLRRTAAKTFLGLCTAPQLRSGDWGSALRITGVACTCPRSEVFRVSLFLALLFWRVHVGSALQSQRRIVILVPMA